MARIADHYTEREDAWHQNFSNYQKKILLKLRGAMLRWGRRAPDRTLRFGAERTASGGVLVEAWVIMLTGRHGLSARLRAMVRGVGLGVPRQ